LPIPLTPLFFELDGSFPNHEANPIDPENLRDLQRAVKENKADIGLAFDGDADRCFIVDERGEIVSPSVLAGLIATRELAREPGGAVSRGRRAPPPPPPPPRGAAGRGRPAGRGPGGGGAGGGALFSSRRR